VQVIERRKSLAEVIQAELDSALPELRESVRRDAGVLRESAFGDLKTQIFRI